MDDAVHIFSKELLKKNEELKSKENQLINYFYYFLAKISSGDF